MPENCAEREIHYDLWPQAAEATEGPGPLPYPSLNQGALLQRVQASSSVSMHLILNRGLYLGIAIMLLICLQNNLVNRYLKCHDQLQCFIQRNWIQRDGAYSCSCVTLCIPAAKQNHFKCTCIFNHCAKMPWSVLKEHYWTIQRYWR